MTRKQSHVADLLQRARGPMGPQLEVDFNRPEQSWDELGRMISALNGFFVFDAGIQVFRVGEDGRGPDLGRWNSDELWKHTYGRLADDLFIFSQDLWGTQFGIDAAARVVTLDPETADRTVIGDSLENWAAWLLGSPNVNGCAAMALAWQRANRALQPDERLIPRELIVTGGEITLENLEAIDSAKAMRIRGPIAQQVHALPDGARIDLQVG